MIQLIILSISINWNSSKPSPSSVKILIDCLPSYYSFKTSRTNAFYSFLLITWGVFFFFPIFFWYHYEFVDFYKFSASRWLLVSSSTVHYLQRAPMVSEWQNIPDCVHFLLWAWNQPFLQGSWFLLARNGDKLSGHCYQVCLLHDLSRKSMWIIFAISTLFNSQHILYNLHHSHLILR